MALVLSVLWTTFASSSVLSDIESGQAANIVEANNIIHVYTYLGASTEAEFMSTFDEGEDWTDLPLVPAKAKTSSAVKAKAPTLYSRVNRNTAVTVESDYVKMIDECTAIEDKIWDYRTDTCVDYY